MSPLPRPAIEAGWVALDRRSRPWTIAAEDFFLPGETFRDLVSGLLGLDADGVAVTPSVSFGLSTFATLVPLAKGQVVLVPDDEFPSNFHPWHAAAERAGATVERVPRSEAGRFDDVFAAEIERLGDRVALVASPACHWTDGTPIDLVELGRLARGVGAAFAVDLSQSLGAMPFDGAAVQPDVVAGVSYKWLLGPYALSYAWFGPEWREGEPLDHGWAIRAGADDFAGLTEAPEGYRPGARRYDIGEAAQHHLMPIAHAAMRVILDWGVTGTAAHARRLSDHIADRASALGYGVAPSELRSPHIIGVRPGATGLESRELGAHLAEERVHVSVRGDALRVSLHRFNDDEDVERLLGALASAVGASGPV
jgi:selenocysteine lyase/cysteine desulfurase